MYEMKMGLMELKFCTRIDDGWKSVPRKEL